MTTRFRIRSSSRPQEDEVCPWCRDTLSGDLSASSCPSCGVTAHSECQESLGSGCPTLGCESGPRARARRPRGRNNHTLRRVLAGQRGRRARRRALSEEQQRELDRALAGAVGERPLGLALVGALLGAMVTPWLAMLAGPEPLTGWKTLPAVIVAVLPTLIGVWLGTWLGLWVGGSPEAGE